MGKNVGTDDIFRWWEGWREKSEVEDEQRDGWAEDQESCP